MNLPGWIKRITDSLPEGENPESRLAERSEISAMEHKMLSGKNVLVTGAGRNIGKAIALEMAGEGANVFFADIDRHRSRELEKELQGCGVVSRGFVSDISTSGGIDALWESLLDDGINIDVLVNNLGVQFKTDTIFEFQKSEWEKTFNVNLFGPLYLTRLVVGNMRSAQMEGSVLFVTSIHQWTVRTIASYSSSKAALGMAVKELALDLAPYGIRVNGIAPGWVAEDEKGRPLKHKYCPLYNTSISPRYIGRAAVYLSSDYFSRQTTGSVLKIDGGLSLWNHCHEQKLSKGRS